MTAAVIREIGALPLYDEFVEPTPVADTRIVDLVTTDQDSNRPARMANAIIEITHETGGCLPEDLNAKGFTRLKSTNMGTSPKALPPLN